MVRSTLYSIPNFTLNLGTFSLFRSHLEGSVELLPPLPLTENCKIHSPVDPQLNTVQNLLVPGPDFSIQSNGYFYPSGEDELEQQ